ncbi:holin [Corynebacterium phage phi673]|uniref:Putative holin n=1 Tax=Corynebacterium phage phi673 TaxID=2052821 RepID=A0A2H4PJ40_9CAUD|nr:holin [Corynebacterium phage phi673]ATW62885.1 putative holin [Corynebacterium phage phi673]
MSNPLPLTSYRPSVATRKVVLTYLNEQPWYVEKKDLITMVAGGVITLAQLNLVPADAPQWIHIAIGVVTWIAALFVISGTPGAVTKSMEQRLAQTAEQLEQAVPPVAHVPSVEHPQPEDKTDLAYEAGEAARIAAEDEARFNEVVALDQRAGDYQGEHRATP